MNIHKWILVHILYEELLVLHHDMQEINSIHLYVPKYESYSPQYHSLMMLGSLNLFGLFSMLYHHKDYNNHNI